MVSWKELLLLLLIGSRSRVNRSFYTSFPAYVGEGSFSSASTKVDRDFLAEEDPYDVIFVRPQPRRPPLPQAQGKSADEGNSEKLRHITCTVRMRNKL